MSTAPDRANALSRLALTRRLVALLLHEDAVVAGIGNTNFDLAAAGHHPVNIYMLGSMVLAASIALGVALAQPGRQILALEGDGSLLMNLSCLATIATAAPPNLTLIVWDNGAYQITGGQPAATAAGTDLVAVAREAGITRSAWAPDEDAFVSLVEHVLGTPGSAFVAARVAAPGAERPECDPVLLKDRFMRASACAEPTLSWLVCLSVVPAWHS